MLHPTLLPALYLANTLWFLLAFLQFSFRPHRAMTTGSSRIHSPNLQIRNTPAGDPRHHDLLTYLGGMNLAPAALGGIRLATLLAAPNTNIWVKSALTTGSATGDRPLDVLSLLVLGVANFSQARVNLCVVRKTGRWVLGEVRDSITLMDGLLTILDWTAAIAVACSV